MAMLGTVVGTLTRHQDGAITALATWALAVEALLRGRATHVPGEPSNALAGLTTAHLLDPLICLIPAWARPSPRSEPFRSS